MKTTIEQLSNNVDQLQRLGDILRSCKSPWQIEAWIRSAFEVRNDVANGLEVTGRELKTSIDKIAWDSGWALAKAAHMIGTQEDQTVFMQFRDSLKEGSLKSWPGELRIVRTVKDQ